MKRKYLFLVLLTSLICGCGSSSTSEGDSSEIEISEESISSSEEVLSSENISKVDTTSFILEDLKKGLDNSSKIKNGTFTYNEPSKKTTWTYEFGEDKYGDFVKINEKNITTPTDIYYGYDASGNVYGIQDTYGKVRNVGVQIVGNEVYGPSVDVYKEKLSGAQGIMSKVYDLAVNNQNYDFTDLSGGNNKKFSVSCFVDGLIPSVWLHTVSYKMSDDVFTNLEIVFEQYNEITADYEFNNVYYINEGAKPVATYSVAIEQIVGERTLTNPYDIETFFFTSFDFNDSTNNLIDEDIYMDAKIEVNLFLTNSLPSTASAAVDTITLKEETGNVKASFLSTTKKLTINCEEEGDYDILISSRKVTKTYKLHVSKPAPAEANCLYYVPSGNGYVANVIEGDSDGFTMYQGSQVIVRGTFSPYNADQSYTFEMTSSNTSGISYVEDKFKPVEMIDTYSDAYRITALEVGVYDFKISSVKNPAIYKEFSIEVIEAPNFEDLIYNRYVRISDTKIYVDVDFTPNEENPKTGKVYINDINDNASYSGNYNYVYDETTKKFALTKLDSSGNELPTTVKISLEFNGNYNLVFFNGQSYIELNVFSQAFMISRIEWIANDSGGGWTTLYFNADGTGSFTYYKSDENFNPIVSYNCDINYEVIETEEKLIVSLDETSISNIEASGFISKIGEISIGLDYKNFTATMTIYDVDEVLNFTIGG